MFGSNVSLLVKTAVFVLTVLVFENGSPCVVEISNCWAKNESIFEKKIMQFLFNKISVFVKRTIFLENDSPFFVKMVVIVGMIFLVGKKTVFVWLWYILFGNNYTNVPLQ